MSNVYSDVGFEISDVLKIDDKDYAITFSLYFSVEWFEPRLNLSAEVWGADQPDLIPGISYQVGGQVTMSSLCKLQNGERRPPTEAAKIFYDL